MSKLLVFLEDLYDELNTLVARKWGNAGSAILFVLTSGVLLWLIVNLARLAVGKPWLWY